MYRFCNNVFIFIFIFSKYFFFTKQQGKKTKKIQRTFVVFEYLCTRFRVNDALWFPMLKEIFYWKLDLNFIFRRLFFKMNKIIGILFNVSAIRNNNTNNNMLYIEEQRLVNFCISPTSFFFCINEIYA